MGEEGQRSTLVAGGGRNRREPREHCQVTMSFYWLIEGPVGPRRLQPQVCAFPSRASRGALAGSTHPLYLHSSPSSTVSRHLSLRLSLSLSLCPRPGGREPGYSRPSAVLERRARLWPASRGPAWIPWHPVACQPSGWAGQKARFPVGPVDDISSDRESVSCCRWLLAAWLGAGFYPHRCGWQIEYHGRQRISYRPLRCTLRLYGVQASLSVAAPGQAPLEIAASWSTKLAASECSGAREAPEARHATAMEPNRRRPKDFTRLGARWAGECLRRAGSAGTQIAPTTMRYASQRAATELITHDGHG